MGAPTFRLANTVLGTPDPRGLAAFYVALLGWRYRDDDVDPTWVVIKPPEGEGDVGLSFQLEEDHVPPRWPAGPDQQQMQVHLDIGVEELPPAVARAEELGARQAEHQAAGARAGYARPRGPPVLPLRARRLGRSGWWVPGPALT